MKALLCGLKVNARWLQDLDDFNEWMNEEDYLDEENEVSFCQHLMIPEFLMKKRRNI